MPCLVHYQLSDAVKVCWVVPSLPGVKHFWWPSEMLSKHLHYLLIMACHKQSVPEVATLSVAVCSVHQPHYALAPSKKKKSDLLAYLCTLNLYCFADK